MIKHTGAQESAAGSSDPLQAWRQIAQQLCPLIGESGFCALFGRAVHVVGPDHAWLAPRQPCRSPEQLFAMLEEAMSSADAGMLAMSRQLDNNAVVRKIGVIKMRGQAHLAGTHTLRVTGVDGVQPE